MATLEGKIILVVGGSSGIGYGVAKVSLLSGASKVIIASSSKSKVESAVGRLNNELSKVGGIKGTVSGDVVDAKETKNVKELVDRVGEIDHLVWTSVEHPPQVGPNLDVDSNKAMFDVRFWGAYTAAKEAKIRAGGSITFTVGQLLLRPPKGFTPHIGVPGAIDSLTRGLAVDLAPIRVNVVSPGIVETELLDRLPPKLKQYTFSKGKEVLVQHIGQPEEVAEAYIFLMKCSYITGQRIEVDGGLVLI